MRRVISFVVLVMMIAGASILPVAAQEASPQAGSSLLADLGYPEIHVTSDGMNHDFPSELEAGRYHLVLENQSEMEVNLEIMQLPQDVPVDELVAFFEGAGDSDVSAIPDFFFNMTFNGGPIAYPGQTSGVVLDLTPGVWVVNHYTFDEATEEEVNAITEFTVTGEMPNLEAPTGFVDATLIEMDFMVPDTIEAGPQIWNISSRGLQVHHLILSKVPEGTTEDQVMELVASFMGPPPAADATPEAGALSEEDVEDIFNSLLFSFNQYNLYEIDLEPGTYVMLCFMPDPSGTPHVMLGMIEMITVE